MHQRLSRAAALLVLVLVPGLSSSPGRVLAQTPATAINPADVIPFDGHPYGDAPQRPQILRRRNDLPAKRISLRLAVKAGSLDKRTINKGSPISSSTWPSWQHHFKPGEVFSYFSGRCTARAATLHKLRRNRLHARPPPPTDPTSSPRLTALADFAGGLTLTGGEVDKERGVVIQEWRGGLGAGSRIRDKQIPILYYQSRYAERLPIGKPDVIRTAPVERLRAFYDTWYRPERMAVIAVGDIDPSRSRTPSKPFRRSQPGRRGTTAGHGAASSTDARRVVTDSS
jgi:hypothetical protein